MGLRGKELFMSSRRGWAVCYKPEDHWVAGAKPKRRHGF